MTGRDRRILVIIAMLVVVVGGWLLFVQPKRSRVAALGQQVDTAQSQLTAARNQLAQATAARAAYARDYAYMARLGEAVPPDDNVPSLIYQLQSAANASQVDFHSLQMTGSASSTTSSSAPGGSKAGALPPGVAIGPGGFPAEPFTFQFRGNFFHLSDFLGRLQQFVTATNGQIAIRGRLLTLNALSFAAGPQGFPTINATISATSYLLPASQGLTAGATPAGPSSSSPQPVSSAPASSPTISGAITPIR